MFDLLDEIPSAIANMDNADLRRAEKVLNAHKIEHSLTEFIENFFLQFFGNGYNIKVDGVNTSSLDFLKKELDAETKRKGMIVIFEKAITIKRNLQLAVYSSPPKRAVLIEAYRDFIPEMLFTFKNEGNLMQGYSQLVERIDKVLEQIKSSQSSKK